MKQLKGVKMLDEITESKIIGYTINKKPNFADEYRKEISDRISKIKSGEVKTYTSKVVLDSIIK